MSSPRERLLELLRTRAWRKGTFTLASGKQSDFFIDCKQVLLSAEGHLLAGTLFLEALQQHKDVQGVAGVALGGCPLASAVALLSQQQGRPLDALYVRKEAKDHGTRALVEGSVPEGASIALLEDVLTTGGSSIAAVERLTAAGYRVSAVLALVDRREGGLEALRAKVPFAAALFAREDFLG